MVGHANPSTWWEDWEFEANLHCIMSFTLTWTMLYNSLRKPTIHASKQKATKKPRHKHTDPRSPMPLWSATTPSHWEGVFRDINMCGTVNPYDYSTLFWIPLRTCWGSSWNNLFRTVYFCFHHRFFCQHKIPPKVFLSTDENLSAFAWTFSDVLRNLFRPSSCEFGFFFGVTLLLLPQPFFFLPQRHAPGLVAATPLQSSFQHSSMPSPFTPSTNLVSVSITALLIFATSLFLANPLKTWVNLFFQMPLIHSLLTSPQP